MSAAVEIRAPSEQTEGTRSQVLRWLKRPGERVHEHEPLVEIETDKVTVEVAAPASGVLREVLKREEEEIAPGELLGRLELLTASVAPVAEAAEAAAAAAPGGPGAAAGSEAAAGSGAAAESGSTAGSGSAELMPGAPARAGRAPPSGQRTGAAGMSPAVRRLMAEHGLELAAVAGSDEGGRITVQDVLRAAAGAAGARPEVRGAQPEATGAQPEPPGPFPSMEHGLKSRSVPHSAVRKRTAAHMVQSLLHTAPHVTTVFEADMTAVQRSRARLREEFAQRGVPLTLTAYFVQAAVAAIREVPEVNSRWTESALEIYEAIHVGIATAVEGRGLVVPVLHDAGSRDLLETARGLDALVTHARSGKLTPAEMRGGTFTISNHGVSGSLLAAPIVINQPQSAILGVGKLEKRAVVAEEGDEERIVVRQRCFVTLTIDHRVLDGHQANHFMRAFVQSLNDWHA